MSDEALALQKNYPEGNVQGYLDRNIYTRLLRCSAEASAEYFRAALLDLSSGANIQEEHLKSSLHDPEALTIIFAPVKGLERTLVKFGEYAFEAGASQWPVAPQVRDMLRAKIEAPNGDAFADATDSIVSTFDIREGNGRLKNNLMTEKHQPPNVLTNLVLRPPGMPPITAEVQIHLRDIVQLVEHRYYEVRVSNVGIERRAGLSCSASPLFRSFERLRRRCSLMKGVRLWKFLKKRKSREPGKTP